MKPYCEKCGEFYGLLYHFFRFIRMNNEHKCPVRRKINLEGDGMLVITFNRPVTEERIDNLRKKIESLFKSKKKHKILVTGEDISIQWVI